MNCDDFRKACIEGVRDAETLAHLRSCADCLEFGVNHDPDLLFRSIGGDIEPPGGTELFAAEVMQQIHIRETEKAASPTWHRNAQWAAAAILVAAMAGSLVMFRPGPAETPDSRTMPVVPIASTMAPAPILVPVVDKYESEDAMIVEMPSEAGDEIRVVMIFDENLPVDL